VKYDIVLGIFKGPHILEELHVSLAPFFFFFKNTVRILVYHGFYILVLVSFIFSTVKYYTVFCDIFLDLFLTVPVFDP